MKTENQRHRTDINVTPMVDVMLVMLIIFMVITPMLSKGVSVDMAKTDNPIAMAAPTRKTPCSSRSPAMARSSSERTQTAAADLAGQGQGPADQPAGQDLLS